MPRPRREVFLSTRNTLLFSDPERLIGIGRAVTVGFALLAMYLDPTQPRKFQYEVSTLLAAYGVFAAVLLLKPIDRPTHSLAHLWVHLIDSIVLGLLAFLSNELTSPFFSFFSFPLLAMTIRWGLKGTIFGALILEIMLLVIGIPDILDGVSELNYLIVRGAYFLVFATMLGYFAAYREQSRARLISLANWPTDNLAYDQYAWLSRMCRHATTVLDGDELIVVWREQESARGCVAHWRSGQLSIQRNADPEYWGLVETDAFDLLPARGARLIDRSSHSLMKRALGIADNPSAAKETTVIAANFHTLRFTGLCAVSNPDSRPEDALCLVEIIASHFAGELERFDLVSQVSDIARSEEREKLARDLHDGVLQDLTAITLKLRNAHAPLPEQKPVLREIEMLIAEQQRRIRHFVENQRDRRSSQTFDAASELRVLVERLANQWGIDVEIEEIDVPSKLPRPVLENIEQLVSEATANAVRHGSSRQVLIRLSGDSENLALVIRDDGKGMSEAKFDTGSSSLRSRLEKFGGSMSIGHAFPGLEITMSIPMRGRA
ncbi:MAG: ATP-binding protein [Porphyrobacter sp.]|nr:ATP-binding protein [Porphyrobacter sp.]